MLCLQMMTSKVVLAATAFRYEMSDIEVTGAEIKNSMEISMTRQFFAAITITVSILLFFYSLFFVMFWYMEKRRITTNLPLFTWITLGTRTAAEMSFRHIIILALSMISVVMLVLMGVTEGIIKTLFIKMIGAWF